jgi:iron complex outermembrane receptor protein
VSARPKLASGPAGHSRFRPRRSRLRPARRQPRGASLASIALCLLCGAGPFTVAAAHADAPRVAQADVLTPPKVLHGVKAEYPPEAAASDREGDVVVLATISARGDVSAVEVAEHGGDPFDDAALAAARQWKFSPALRNGKPIESQVRIPFHFRHGHAPEPPAPPSTPPQPTAPSPAPRTPSTPPITAPRTPTTPPTPAQPTPTTPPTSAQPTPTTPPTPAPRTPTAPQPSAQPTTSTPQPPAQPTPEQPSAPAQPTAPTQPTTPEPTTATPATPPVESAPLPVAPEAQRTYESSVAGRIKAPPSRGTSDYHVDVGTLSLVPRANATEFLKLAPGILLTNEGGEGHAEQVFLRGFDAREGQDIEFTVDGEPFNESGNLHGNGYADTHFIIPELVQSLRVVEGSLDPRQGNYAVAGSVDYHLGLADRGITAKFSAGSYGTYGMFLAYGPPHMSDGTFAAADLYQSDGFGQNRDGRRGRVMAQYEGGSGNTHYRLFGQAYVASFHTAGVIRDDDYRAGRIGFYDSYDITQHAALPQGEDAQRYSIGIDISHKGGHIVTDTMIWGVVRPLRLRENFTGFLLDTQDPLQPPHGQRGDEIDLNTLMGTVGLKGSASLSGMVLHQLQSIEIGYFARGDFGSATQQRIEAATGAPYHTDVDQSFNLGDIGLYGDLSLRPARWLALRGGVRGDVFTFAVRDNCAVQSIEHPNPNEPLFGQSCYSEENFGAYREPNQWASTVSAAYMPRGSILVGPFWGLSATGSVGQGVRSIDPVYITQDAKTPFASITDYEGGLSYAHRFADTIDLSLSSVFFDTKVDRDLIFSQTAGRNTLAGATTRLGSASQLRLVGPFYDLSLNLTYVNATFDDTHYLVPYVPDLVFRGDTAVFGVLPWRWSRWWGKPLFASLSAGVTYVGPRALPYGDRSDTIFTIDANATLRWWMFETGVSAMNLLDAKYRLGEYNYASDFHSQSFPTLVPVRHFSAGAPLTVLWSFAIHYGDRR